MLCGQNFRLLKIDGSAFTEFCTTGSYGCDTCIYEGNPGQVDTDCDGIIDDCDVCPGSDDTVDTNDNGVPDCMDTDIPAFEDLPDSWKCSTGGSQKVYVHHENNIICVGYNSLADHIGHGDFFGMSDCDDANRRAVYSDNLVNKVITFPNPVIDRLTMQSDIYINEIKLTNTRGQVLLHKCLLDRKLNTYTINTSEYIQGIYFLQCDLIDGTTEVKKVVVR